MAVGVAPDVVGNLETSPARPRRRWQGRGDGSSGGHPSRKRALDGGRQAFRPVLYGAFAATRSRPSYQTGDNPVAG